jgi:iron complex outermembrane receptor protein
MSKKNKNNNPMKKSVIVVQTALAIALAFSVFHARAAEETEETDESAKNSALENVVVIATRRPQSLQKTAISVNVMGENYLEEMSLDDVDDAFQLSPSTSFVRFIKTVDEYSMRGVSSQGEGSSGEASVQVVSDSVVLGKSFFKNTPFFDVDRVEVLRGPQGTTFGRNASAGLLHIITKRPSQDFEGNVKITAGDFNLGVFEGMVNGGLSDTVSGRLAVHIDSRDGYTTDTVTGDDLDGESNKSIRGSLLFAPADDLEIYVKLESNSDDDDGPVRRSQDCTQPNGVTSPTGNPADPANWHPVFNHPDFGGTGTPRTSTVPYTDSCNVWETQISSGIDFFLERDVTNLTTEIVYSINDRLTLSSITGYIDAESEYLIDALGTPTNLLFQNTSDEGTQFSQEFRLDNHAAGEKLSWLAGVFLLQDEHDRFDENIFFADVDTFGGGISNIQSIGGPFLGGGPKPETRDTKINSAETDSIAIYGELDYEFTDQLSVKFSARYTRDDKAGDIAHTNFGFSRQVVGNVDPNDLDALLDNDIANVICVDAGGPPRNCPLFGFGVEGLPVSSPVHVEDEWDNFSYNLTFNYQARDNLMFYGTVATGFKSGGFQAEPATIAAAKETFDEETSRNIEFGMKSQWMDKLRVNLSVYDLQYDDLQITQFRESGESFSSFIANAGGVETKGLELETILSVTDDLTLTYNYARLDAEYTDFIIPIEGGFDDFTGNRPDNAPEWTGSARVNYNYWLENGSSFTLAADWRGRSLVYDGPEPLERRERPGVDVYGASIKWSSKDDNWSVLLWGKNLTEEEIPLNFSPDQPHTNQLVTTFDAPRTWGVTANHRFD